MNIPWYKTLKLSYDSSHLLNHNKKKKKQQPKNNAKIAIFILPCKNGILKMIQSHMFPKFQVILQKKKPPYSSINGKIKMSWVLECSDTNTVLSQ